MPDDRADRLAAINWIVQGNAVLNGDLLRAVADDRSVALIEQIANDCVVLAMSSSRADDLKLQFGRALLVEPDQQLTRIDPMTPDN